MYVKAYVRFFYQKKCLIFLFIAQNDQFIYIFWDINLRV